MATATGTYLGDLRVELRHEQSGATITTDAPVDNHGKGEAFSPTDMVGAALGACAMTIIGIYGKKHDVDVSGMIVIPGLVQAHIEVAALVQDVGHAARHAGREVGAHLAEDNDKTNQQWFVQLNDGVVEVNKENLTGAYTQAIGRTPIVRVDAYLPSNGGTKQMVASSYIKLSIAATVAPDKDDNNVQIAADAEKLYRALTADMKDAGADIVYPSMPEFASRLPILLNAFNQNSWNSK